MTRVIVGDFRTGRRLLDLPFLSLSWEAARNKAETITATASLTDPDVLALNLRSAATPGKAYLAVIENDQFMAGGPIWTHTYDRDAQTLRLTAAGMWSYWDHRVLLPVLAANQAALGADTNLTGLDLGTIAKRLVQQAQTWTGGNIPIVFETDRVGTRERNYLGADIDIIGGVLADLTGVENGPDIEFRPRWTANRLGVEWVMRTGSEMLPRLGSPSVHVWDYTVPEPAIGGLEVTVDASQMTGQAFTSGGRNGDEVLIARSSDTVLTDAGFPLLESVDSTHSSVSDVGTLAAYSVEAVRNGVTPNEFWSFKVRADERPTVGEYWLGDQARIIIRDDPMIPDGSYRAIIASLSGDEAGKWIKVKAGSVALEDPSAPRDLVASWFTNAAVTPSEATWPDPNLYPAGSTESTTEATTAQTPATPVTDTPTLTAPTTAREDLVWGTYTPDATTTGLKPGTAAASLPAYSGPYTVTTPGTVIQNVRLDDYLLVRAANVIVRNCWVRGPATMTATSQTALINANHSACVNLLVEDCEIVPAGPGIYVDGITGHDYIARRCNIYQTVDGFGVFNSQSGMTTAAVNVLIEQNYVHHLAYWSPDPTHSDNRSHNDCIQIQGNSGITIRGNTLDALVSNSVGQGYPTVSPTPPAVNPYYPSVTGQAIGLTPNVSAITGVTITKNWLRAGAQSITIIPGSMGTGTTASITDNVFIVNSNPTITKGGVAAKRPIQADPTLTLPTLPSATGSDISNNRYEDGTPVTVYRIVEG